jgi:hypothetical protein
VGGAVEVVDEDVAADAHLVAQQPGIGQLGLERVVVGDMFARVSLADVDEHPVDVWVAVGRVVEQRTLCGAVWSGERPELQDRGAVAPSV